MKTFELDENGSLEIVDRRFVLTRDFIDALVLRIRNAFAVCRHEFALDEEAGFPYYPFVAGVKSPDIGSIRSIYLRHLLRTEGVANGDIQLTFDATNRKLIVNGSAVGDDGTRLEILDGQVFVRGEKI